MSSHLKHFLPYFRGFKGKGRDESAEIVLEGRPPNNSFNYDAARGGQHQADIMVLRSPSENQAIPFRPSSHRIIVRAAAVTAIVCLVLNTMAAIWLAFREDFRFGLASVFVGSCETAQKMKTGIHALINALSTLLIAGSNYAMQCLCAPSRQDIDNNHRKGRYFDIGIPSMRNLQNLPKYKAVLWFLLLLSSFPIHLLYNAAFYFSTWHQDYNIYIVSHNFISDVPINFTIMEWQHSDPQYIREELEERITDTWTQSKSNESWENLSPYDCINAYGRPLVTDRRQVLLFTSDADKSPHYSTVLKADSSRFLQHYFIDPFRWMCSLDSIDIGRGYCRSKLSQLKADADRWMVFGHHIDGCLSEKVPETCSLIGNTTILITVIICNAIKASIMLSIANRRSENPLLTIGDAIQSFLQVPDKTTKHLSWMDKSDIDIWGKIEARSSRLRKVWPAEQDVDYSIISAQRERPFGAMIHLKNHRWGHAATRRRWVWTLTLLMGANLSLCFIRRYAVRALQSHGTGSDVLNRGFGHTDPITMVINTARFQFGSVVSRATIVAIVAGLPQLIVSSLYFCINGLVTMMLCAHEWSKLSKCRDFLRVTNPRGKQKSTFYLSLPYNFAIPLMAYFGILHWVASASLYPAVISISPVVRRDYGRPVDNIITWGFSPSGMLAALILGLVLGASIIALGYFGTLDGRARLVNGCSAAISAGCHAPSRDIDAALKRIKYGAVPRGTAENAEMRWVLRDSQDRGRLQNRIQHSGGSELYQHPYFDNDHMMEIGHLCLTSGEVEDPKENVLYS